MATASTPRAAASVSVAGRAPSVMYQIRSVSTRSAGVMGFVSWALVFATLDTKERTVKKVNMSDLAEVCRYSFIKKQLICLTLSLAD